MKNKNDLIAAVASESDLSQADAGRAVEATFSEITSALSEGTEVRVAGFGIFTVADRPARMARNPRTGEPVSIPASKAARFRPGKNLKDSVNGR